MVGEYNERLIFGQNQKPKRNTRQVILVSKNSSIYLRFRVYEHWMYDWEKSRDEVGEKGKDPWYKAQQGRLLYS